MRLSSEAAGNLYHRPPGCCAVPPGSMCWALVGEQSLLSTAKNKFCSTDESSKAL